MRGEPWTGVLISPSRLAVWGDPIDHSRSPDLHGAAYRVLGLDWEYVRHRVDAREFLRELDRLDESWRGLSLTYPLKSEAHAASAWRDRPAELTGAVNTLLLTPDGPRGFNTDVGGIVRDLREKAITAVDTVRLVGAGATATSALVAVAEIGARDVEVAARRPQAVAPLQELGDRLGVAVMPVPLFADAYSEVDLTIATMPGGADLAPDTARALAADGGALYDVVYGHWPTSLANAWTDAGHPAYHGLGMLLQQAVLQVRIFVQGTPDTPLDGEESVVGVMRRALMGD